ncbi:hypothetical protein LIER_25744 [Lithospermum erythrorhizon]|uniref:Retrotransposon gag domain-containing protein n=1 Tax=Lithospermum erythrorhizon TaxID=34254 RepID=A0AAV3R641_LITER
MYQRVLQGEGVTTRQSIKYTDQSGKEYILGEIKDHEDRETPSYTYIKSYTSRIDQLKMPKGHQPPKFQHFDGTGNPKQHVAHFVETCNNVGTEGDEMVKQFVRSLKGNAFDWYTDLEPASIDSWAQLESEFLNRFFSAKRTVSMMELKATKKRREELVIESINRLRSLNLKCKDRLSESSTISMCIQDMHWDLQYIM